MQHLPRDLALVLARGPVQGLQHRVCFSGDLAPKILERCAHGGDPSTDAPGHQARGAHAAWVDRKELESRRIQAGAGTEEKSPCRERPGEKRASRTLREEKAPAPAAVLNQTPCGRGGRAGIERVPAARFCAGVPRRPVTDQAAGYLLSSRCVWDAWAGLEPAANRLWVCCSTAELPREKMEAIRRPLFRRFPQSQLRHLCYPQCGGRHPGTDRFLRDDKRPQCAASCSMPEHRPHRRAS